jgi:hypothetical protein
MTPQMHPTVDLTSNDSCDTNFAAPLRQNLVTKFIWQLTAPSNGLDALLLGCYHTHHSANLATDPFPEQRSGMLFVAKLAN